MELTLEQIADRLGLPLTGDSKRIIRGVAPIGEATPEQISFADSPRWERMLSKTRAGAVIVSSDPDVEGLNFIVADNPRLAFMKVILMFHPLRRRFDGISPLASVADDAVIGEPTSVAPFAAIGTGTQIGPRTVIAPGVVIGERVTIGQDCTLRPNVVVEKGVRIGDRVTIHAGTVIGADGYGYIQHDGVNMKIPQVGSVRIGDDVEIGANVCIDRGALGDTVIGNDVKIDNLAQIGHSVQIGDGTLVVAQVGLSGSVRIGRRCILAGKSGSVEHVTIGDGATIAAVSTVTSDVEPGATVAGYPARDIENWRRSSVILRNLPRYWPKILSLLKKAEEE